MEIVIIRNKLKRDLGVLEAEYNMLDRRMLELIADMAILKYEIDELKDKMEDEQ